MTITDVMKTNHWNEKLRLILLPALLAAALGFVLSHHTAVQSVHAFSAGPPPGYTGAPGEEPEACAECHVPPDAGTGQISINAPQAYVPGQTYPITVTHTNSDPTRLRWGFELTALDTSDFKAGNFQTLDGTTQILNDAGPGSARQYIEHTAAGTFVGQQNTASWTFNWTAPPADVGVVTFYAAGNQANNDGNTSGDYVYKTFVASAPFSATPDFDISVTPSTQAVVPLVNAVYTVTITPSAGFTGTVNLSATNLPPSAGSSFNPTSVNITDATARSSQLTVTPSGVTPLGDYQITVTASSGSLIHSKQITLRVISPTSIDLAVSKSVSPNPGQVNAALTYRIVVTNGGPNTATNVTLTDELPAGVTFNLSSATQGSCSGTTEVNCSLGNLAFNATAVVTIVVTPSSQGQIANAATAGATETDHDTSNNSSQVSTFIQPAAVSPTMLDPNLSVSTVATGLDQPTSLAFLGLNDFLVLEKASGKVQRIVNGVVQGAVLDLPVNSASERGLLGIALHPQFATNKFAYLFWSESSTGADSLNLSEIALLGNRVDRYIWNGSTLTFDKNIIRLRALQQDAGQPLRGNHNGGVLRFGPDSKLYILFGDNGRRGLLQNITSGGPVPDDEFGGPQPDDAHMTGVVLRVNDDGSTPSDNPFFNASTGFTGEAATNIKKVFGYGVRNGFGMAFDPLAGYLWTQENGDDAFDEMNRVSPGFNGGWIQAMGPLSRVSEFKSIETTYGNGTLQQLRWPPSNIADTPQAALAALYSIPGSQYTDPEFSWKYAVAPAAIGFVKGRGLGPQLEGDLLVGASRTTLLNGFLFRFKFSVDRKHFKFTDSLLNDLVADNDDKFDLAESESLAIGRDFGVVTDIQTGPNGNVFVVSLLNGAVYEIKSTPTYFFATLTGAQEVPPNNSTATGNATLVLSPDEKSARLTLYFNGLSSAQTDAHIHGPAAPGVTAPPIFPLSLGEIREHIIDLFPGQAQDLKNGLWYINVHSANFPGGEIRGQFQMSASASSVQFGATQIGVNEGEGSAVVTITRNGNTSASATVNYATEDGLATSPCSDPDTNSASERCDYQKTSGTVTFAPGETLKTINIPIVDDSYAEDVEHFLLVLSSPSGATIGPPGAVIITISDNETINGPNPIDDPAFFVRQHYLDFLNREPDAAGFAFWTNQITSCGSDAACVEIRRINVSAAFFLSIEFQESSNFIYRMYKGALGRKPTYEEFLSDRTKIPTADGVPPNKFPLLVDFVTRPEFMAKYPVGSPFIDVLLQTVKDHSGVDLSSIRSDLLMELDNCRNLVGQLEFCQARIVERVVDQAAFRQAVFSESFVLMEYFGYLRRNPNDPPDTDFSGYNFWLNKLNQFNGNFVEAEMVKAFITSGEYRQRFGP